MVKITLGGSSVVTSFSKEKIEAIRSYPARQWPIAQVDGLPNPYVKPYFVTLFLIFRHLSCQTDV
jgi:hypothetical protein